MNSNIVTTDKFALIKQPLDYQLTIHYNNYMSDFSKDYEYMASYMDDEVVQKECPVMYNLICHYGSDKIKTWLNTFIIRNVA